MRLFVDSADPREIRQCMEQDLADGVTTHAARLAKAASASGREPRALLAEICAIVRGPVAVDVIAEDGEGMLREGRALAAVAANVVLKLPPTEEGLKVVRIFSAEHVRTNVTGCANPTQAVLAAKAGAGCVSPVPGRLEEAALDAADLVRKIVAVYRTYELKTEVWVVPVRNASHVLDAALAGAQVASVPYPVLQQVVKPPRP